MNTKNMIELRDGIPVLSGQTACQIAEFMKKVKDIKEEEKSLKNAILTEMEAYGVIKVDTPEMVITYVAPADREKLDTKSLKEELPDIYDSYVTMSPVSASVRIKVK